MLLLSTAVTTLLAFLFRDVISAAYEGILLGPGFLLTAAILYGSERYFRRRRSKGLDIQQMGLVSAMGIGAMQGIAILPGVSRSGSTIAGARLFGLNKDAAAEFSFLLSIPAILGSLILTAAGCAGRRLRGACLGPHLGRHGGGCPERLSGHPLDAPPHPLQKPDGVFPVYRRFRLPGAVGPAGLPRIFLSPSPLAAVLCRGRRFSMAGGSPPSKGIQVFFFPKA